VRLCGGELQLAVNDALHDVYYEADVDKPRTQPQPGSCALSLLQPSRLQEMENSKMRAEIRD
jgi:hypothetical protein